MIKKVFYRTRKDGVNLYRIYSDTTPTLKQLPTGIIYKCWVYKNDKIDFNKSGVIDVENAPYTYEEVYNENN